MLASLNDWNPWWSDRDAIRVLMGKEAEVLHELVRFLEVREIKVLTGVRRSGKSITSSRQAFPQRIFYSSTSTMMF